MRLLILTSSKRRLLQFSLTSLLESQDDNSPIQTLCYWIVNDNVVHLQMSRTRLWSAILDLRQAYMENRWIVFAWLNWI